MALLIERITWKDAHHLEDGWLTLEEAKAQRARVITSVGFIVEGDDCLVVLSSEDLTAETVAAGMVIPQCAVVARKHLVEKYPSISLAELEKAQALTLNAERHPDPWRWVSP